MDDEHIAPEKSSKIAIQEGYIRVSEAVTRLEASMFPNSLGSLPMVQEAKRNARAALRQPAENAMREAVLLGSPRPDVSLAVSRVELSVGFGPRRENAAETIREAAKAGRLPVYLALRGDDCVAPEILRPEIIAAVIPTRGGLPDHPTRVETGPAVSRDVSSKISRGVLVVRAVEFNKWLEAERRKRRWPSQTESKKPRVGRPKSGSIWRDRVNKIVESNEWKADGFYGKDDPPPSLSDSAGQPISALRVILSRFGDPPSHDTISRIVDELFLVAGDRRFRRKAAPRRRLTQNSPRDHRKLG